MHKEAVIGGVACLAVGALGWVGLIMPQGDAKAALDAQVLAMEATNAQTAAQIPQLKAELDGISSQVDGLRQLSAKVPPEIDLPGLYAELNAAALRAGLPGGAENLSVTTPTLVSADPAAGAAAPGADPAAAPAPAAPADPAAAGAGSAAIASFQVSLSVKGTLSQTIAFLDELRAAPRLSVVASSALSVDDQGQTSLQITATYYLQQVDVDGLVAQIETLTNAAQGAASGTVAPPTGEATPDGTAAVPGDSAPVEFPPVDDTLGAFPPVEAP